VIAVLGVVAGERGLTLVVGGKGTQALAVFAFAAAAALAARRLYA